MIRWAGGPSLDSLAWDYAYDARPTTMTPGAPGLDFQTWDYAYDVRPTIMTLSVTSATGEVSRSRSYYRGEQYDSDLGLYYVRARYYNPAMGRFLSRDPNVGYIDEPATLHKYLYAGGDPVNRVDPSGRADTIETIFTVTVVSSPLEIAAEEVGLALTKAFCYIAKTVARATLGVPPGMSHVPGPPGWPGLSAAACRALGF